MNNIRNLRFASLVGLMVIALGACSSPAVVQLQADYPVYDKKTIITDASLIVEGTPLSLDYAIVKARYEGDTPEENPLFGLSDEEIQKAIESDPGVPMTYVTFRVDVVYKGSVRSGETVTVVQTGGKFDNVEYQVGGQTPLAVGQTYLLFAMDSFDGAFAILGGSTGVYLASKEGYVATNPKGAPFSKLTRDEVAVLTKTT